MNRVYAIALNTLREAVRDRVLYAVCALAAFVLLSTRALAELSLDQEHRVIVDLGTATISLFGVLVSLFLGSSLLYKEIERKTLYMVLPKPIHRHEFLVGKFFGIVLTGWTFVAITGAVFLLLLGTVAGGSALLAVAIATGAALAIGALARSAAAASSKLDPTMVVLAGAALAFGMACAFCGSSGEVLAPHLRSMVLVAMEVAVLTAVALFFSSFSTPFLTGALSAGIWIMGRSADTLQTIRSRLLPDEIKSLLRGLAEVVPNFNLFVPGTQTLGTGADAPWAYVFTSLGYGALYATALLALASWIFRRRDLA
ncbi:MAG: hypothetical protein AAF938_22440 [Myxococcota bacterium]